jgi:caa(3)-type oxidase subunit IV
MSVLSEDIKKHVGLYVKVGGTLLVLTVVTVAMSYVNLVLPLAVAVALFIAITKGSLVASFFMHLIAEKKAIYWSLILTVAFLLALMFLPLLGAFDQVGTSTQTARPTAEAAHEGGR